ncbi:MAG TPA: phosphate regulon sensor histidine kinase PhoR [Burkholderiales bacterium]
MSQIYRSTGVALLVIAVLAVLAGLVGGAAWGWALCAAGLAFLAGYHVRHLARLAGWVADPKPGQVPEGSGSWDTVLSALHRYERQTAGRQKELGDALADFRRAAQAMPDGVVLLDERHSIQWSNDNAARMLGLHPRDDVGRPIANLVREPDFVDYLGRMKRERSGAVQIPGPAGALLSVQLIPYGDEQTLVLVRDITQAERVETMRRDFVANVSHELRTPLTVLVGFLETVRELKLDPQRLRDYLSMMQDQAARMQRIIEDLLALSQLESAPPPADERVRIAPLLERLRADALMLSGGQHSVTVSAKPAVDLVGSETELTSAFTNLVTNAIRYTPAGGKVTLEWREGPEGASFTVEDTGLGIAPEHLPRLTERFYRVDRSRSRETGGTGLGLAIVKHALARHQALLQVESEPGKGSRFTARFPSARTVPLQAATQPEAG